MNDDAPVGTGRVPAREAAERELSKPAYHEHDPNLLQRTANRLWEWLNSVFTSAADATPGGVLGLLIVGLLVVALFAALWWRLGHSRRTPGTTGTPLFDDGPRGAAEHRDAAEAHAIAGRWNQALQERMRAVVRSLEERALLEPRRGRTADEAAAEAGRPFPGHAARLRAAAGEFDDVTYGGRTAGEQAYLRLRDLDLDLEHATPQLTATAGGPAG